EIRMLLRHRGIADAKSLQPRALDEARGVISRRVGEHRAAAPLPDRLRRAALLEERAHLALVRARTALEAQARGDEPFLGRGRDDLAIADAVLAGRALLRLAAAVDGFHAEHVAPGFPAKGAGVHRQGAAEGPGNAGEEFRRPQAPLDAVPGDARTGDTGLNLHRGLVEARQGIERAVQADH